MHTLVTVDCVKPLYIVRFPITFIIVVSLILLLILIRRHFLIVVYIIYVCIVSSKSLQNRLQICIVVVS